MEDDAHLRDPPHSGRMQPARCALLAAILLVILQGVLPTTADVTPKSFSIITTPVHRAAQQDALKSAAPVVMQEDGRGAYADAEPKPLGGPEPSVPVHTSASAAPYMPDASPVEAFELGPHAETRRRLHQTATGNKYCNTNGTACCAAGDSACQATWGKGSTLPTCPSGQLYNPSSLYGCQGEDWTQTSRLIDPSYAGYRAGESAIPTPTTNIYNIKSNPYMNATGDGVANDTQAFLVAMTKAPAGAVLYLPQGTYYIDRQIARLVGGLIIRGAGPALTWIFIPVAMEDVYGNVVTNDVYGNTGLQSEWSFSGAFIYMYGYDPRVQPYTLLANITANAKIGDTILTTTGTSLFTSQNITAGVTWIRLTMDNPPDSSLAVDLQHNMFPAGPDYLLDNITAMVRWQTRIVAYGPNWVRIERPLPFNISTAWNPALRLFEPYTQESGIEGVTINFKTQHYLGHFQEAGFNAIQFNNLANSWIRNVVIYNADTAISLFSCYFITVQNVQFLATAGRPALAADQYGYTGHHGVQVAYSTDIMLKSNTYKTRFWHDVGFDWYTMQSVVSSIQFQDGSLDHHTGALYANCYTNLNLGNGTRPYLSGGNVCCKGPNAASYVTYWNFATNNGSYLTYPSNTSFGPYLNFVAVDTDPTKTVSSPYNWLEENVAPVYPPDIQAAMLYKRLTVGVSNYFNYSQPAPSAASKPKTTGRRLMSRLLQPIYSAAGGQRALLGSSKSKGGISLYQKGGPLAKLTTAIRHTVGTPWTTLEARLPAAARISSNQRSGWQHLYSVPLNKLPPPPPPPGFNQYYANDVAEMPFLPGSKYSRTKYQD